MDRNTAIGYVMAKSRLSLSARRAWIEIINIAAIGFSFSLSLSARRAWIEIVVLCLSCVLLLSLSARRAWIEILYCPYGTTVSSSRSPQGERG